MQNDKDYETLLDRAYSKIKKVEVTERFEIPKVDSAVEGSKTLVSNLLQIASFLRRDINHFTKFLSKELATQIIIRGDQAVFNRRLLPSQINEKIAAYVKEFVTCPQCGKPDTELIKDKVFLFLRCLACGAKHSVRAKIV
ncbi:MAG: translation initiation factor IF-2 subunit beta [Candidatus Pacearchaeota archaeon]|nr:translation initiation factor IF-2 subunit beta [Candidatus Pacearchaeota archaeon]